MYNLIQVFRQLPPAKMLPRDVQKAGLSALLLSAAAVLSVIK